MDQSNVQSQNGVTLVGGGEVDGKDLVESMALAPDLVAADGGANACFHEGVAPIAVIGDLDSILPEALAAFPNARTMKVAEQDSTDFEKCLSRIDAPFVAAVGVHREKAGSYIGGTFCDGAPGGATGAFVGAG